MQQGRQLHDDPFDGKMVTVDYGQQQHQGHNIYKSRKALEKTTLGKQFPNINTR